MHYKDFIIHYISHASFMFVSKKGVNFLVDPFFADGFIMDGHFEKCLTPPLITSDDIIHCDAIFITHEHGDHFDEDAVMNIHGRTKAKVIAPEEVLERLLARGMEEKYFVSVENGREIIIDDIKIVPLAKYDNSFDEKGRPNKFSFIIQSYNTSMFYGGDCHSVPEDLKGKQVDGIFFWPYPDDKKLVDFCSQFKFSDFIFMHGDAFEPGKFICNADYTRQSLRIFRLMRDIKFIIPEKTRVPI